MFKALKTITFAAYLLGLGVSSSELSWAEEVVQDGVDLAPASMEGKSLSELVNAYQDIVSASSARELLNSEGGEQMVKEAHDFVKNPDNAQDLKTAEGKRFLAIHNKFLNYLDTKRKLEHCMDQAKEKFGEKVMNKDSGDIDKRILDSVFSADVSAFKCHPGFTESTNLDDLYNKIVEINDSAQIDHFEHEVYKKSYKKVIQAWVNTKYTYDKDFLSDDKLSDSERKDLEKALCIKECKDEQKKVIDESLPEILENIKASEMKRYSPEEAQKDILKRVNELNKLIKDEGELDKRKVWWNIRRGHTVDQNGENTKRIVEKYQQKYLELSTGGAGSLMWTDTLRDKLGDMANSKDWDWDDGGRAILNSHETNINELDVQEATDEVLKRISDQARKINFFDMSREGDLESRKIRKGDLGHFGFGMSEKKYRKRRVDKMAEYLLMSPHLVGESLIENPNAFKHVCDGIKEYIKSKRNERRWDNAKMGVTVAAGVGAIATGFGAGVGAMLLAGAAVGTLDMAVTGTKALREKEQKNDLINTYFAGSGDEYTLSDAYAAIKDYEAAAFEFKMAVGFFGADVALLGAGKLIRHSPKAMKLQAQAYRAISKSPLGKALRWLFSNADAATRKTYRIFLDGLTSTKSGQRILEFFEKLNPRQLKHIFDRSAKVVKGTCTQGTGECAAFVEYVDGPLSDLAQRNTATITKADIDQLGGNLFVKYADIPAPSAGVDDISQSLARTSDATDINPVVKVGEGADPAVIRGNPQPLETPSGSGSSVPVKPNAVTVNSVQDVAPTMGRGADVPANSGFRSADNLNGGVSRGKPQGLETPQSPHSPSVPRTPNRPTAFRAQAMTDAPSINPNVTRTADATYVNPVKVGEGADPAVIRGKPQSLETPSGSGPSLPVRPKAVTVNSVQDVAPTMGRGADVPANSGFRSADNLNGGVSRGKPQGLETPQSPHSPSVPRTPNRPTAFRAQAMTDAPSINPNVTRTADATYVNPVKVGEGADPAVIRGKPQALETPGAPARNLPAVPRKPSSSSLQVMADAPEGFGRGVNGGLTGEIVDESVELTGLKLVSDSTNAKPVRPTGSDLVPANSARDYVPAKPGRDLVVRGSDEIVDATTLKLTADPAPLALPRPTGTSLVPVRTGTDVVPLAASNTLDVSSFTRISNKVLVGARVGTDAARASHNTSRSFMFNDETSNAFSSPGGTSFLGGDDGDDSAPVNPNVEEGRCQVGEKWNDEEAVCEEIVCEEGLAFDPEANECVTECGEGQVLSEDGLECVAAPMGPPGFFPNMIRRGMGILQGIW